MEFITLSDREARLCARKAKRIFYIARVKGRTPTAGANPLDPSNDLYGTFGEYVWHKATGEPWAGPLGIPDQGSADVGNCHVRTTKRVGGGLIFRHRDPEGLWGLVQPVRAPFLWVCAGWAYSSELKQERYWGRPAGRPACWWIPHRDLQPFRERPRYDP